MDGLARASCAADDASTDGMLLTQLLVGSDTTSGFWPCLEPFGGQSTSLVADAHVLYDPRILMPPRSSTRKRKTGVVCSST
eukprot:scaffold147_cov169-Pinguiococcus_pyrenoidosus.AAC.1